MGAALAGGLLASGFVAATELVIVEVIAARGDAGCRRGEEEARGGESAQYRRGEAAEE